MQLNAKTRFLGGTAGGAATLALAPAVDAIGGTLGGAKGEVNGTAGGGITFGGGGGGGAAIVTIFGVGSA